MDWSSNGGKTVQMDVQIEVDAFKMLLITFKAFGILDVLYKPEWTFTSHIKCVLLVRLA